MKRRHFNGSQITLRATMKTPIIIITLWSLVGLVISCLRLLDGSKLKPPSTPLQSIRFGKSSYMAPFIG